MIDENKLVEKIEKMQMQIDVYRSDGLLSFLILDNFKSIVEEQPKVNEWIPVEERLPDEDGEYLVYCSFEEDKSVGEDKECGYWIANYDTDMEAFGDWQDIYHPVSLGFLDREFNEINTVVAWMPLPKEYEKE